MHLHRIRDLREDRDLTQQEIADLLGIKREVYRRYETGIRDFPLWALVRLSAFYQCSCDYLLEQSDRKERAEVLYEQYYKRMLEHKKQT